MKKILLTLVTLFFLIACSSEDKANENNESNGNTDRTAILINWTDNIIIPAYTNYQNKVQKLVVNVDNFTKNPTVDNLALTRNSWKEAYIAYQKVAMFNFGKANEISFKEKTNAYPTDAIAIETNISSDSYNLDLLSQYSKQGFPAIDYLINGSAYSDEKIVDIYSKNTNANNYKKYLTNVTGKLKFNADLILNDWKSTYRDLYIANNGNSISSAISITTNAFVKNFEKDIRTYKIGIPAGIFSNEILFPQKTEGYYNKNVSREMLNTATQAAQDFFNGKAFNSNATGPSLSYYLDKMKAVRNNKNLSTIINEQFEVIFTKNNDLQEDLGQQTFTNNSKMKVAYDALQQNIIYFKLDMMQSLNITVDYVDNDGD